MNTGPLIAIILFILLFLLASLRAGLGYLQVRRDAKEEWPDFQKVWPKRASGLSAEQFENAYVRAHGPRAPLYGAVMLLIAAVLTPVIMLLLTALYGFFIAEPINATGGPANGLASEVSRQFRLDGPLVYAFFLFFGLIASWGLVAFAVAHRFHRNRPGSLEDELRVERGEGELPEVEVKRPRPKWSPLVQTDDGLQMPKNSDKKEVP